MANLNAEWVMVKTSPDELRAYLLSDELYWPVGHDERLTIGSLILAYKKLEAQISGSQMAELEKYGQAIQDVRERWRSNWGKKAHTEFVSRMHLWADFLGSLFSNPKGQLDRYAYEVRLRVMLELLKDELLSTSKDATRQLSQLDSGLRSYSSDGPFIWEDQLEKAFPKLEYWFLYITFPEQ
jgi:hypothetical protein